jgi:hypothetical protein
MASVIVFGPSLVETSWEEARQRVREALWRRSTSALPDALVDDAIHTALLDLESERRWLWLENLTGALSVPEGADSVGLPPSVKFITSLSYVNGLRSRDPLIQQPLSFVRQLAMGARAGSPEYYAIGDGQIYFDVKIPVDAEFELIFTSTCPRYIDQAISAPPITLTLQRSAIISRAAEHLALSYLKNEEEAARQRVAYERILERLFNEEDQARVDTLAGGCVQPDDGLFRAAHGGA